MATRMIFSHISRVCPMCEIHISRVHHVRNPYHIQCSAYNVNGAWLFSINKLGKVGPEALIVFVVVT